MTRPKMPTVIRCIDCQWVLGTNLECKTCRAERTAWLKSRDYPFPLLREDGLI